MGESIRNGRCEVSQIYGIKLKHKESGRITENWFSKIELRDEWLKMYSSDNFELIKYMNDQQEFNFDIR